MEKICKDINEVGSWGRLFERRCSERVKNGIKRVLTSKHGFCLERAYAEMKAYKEYPDVSRVLLRARMFETYLADKTINIRPDEILVGDFTSEIGYAPFFGEYYYEFVKNELDDPVKDFEVRGFDVFHIDKKTRKELREVVLPFYADKCFQHKILDELMDPVVREKGVPMASKNPTSPACAQLMIQTDIGHTVLNYPKVMEKGFNGIKADILAERAKLEESYNTADRQKRLDFYDAMLICLDAGIAYSSRYSELAAEMAKNEKDPVRKAELEEISRVCAKVPANPVTDFREAMQAMVMIHVLEYCEVINVSQGFARVDQYLYPYYVKSVYEDKTLTREQATELIELWEIKLNEIVQIYNYDNAQTQMGFTLSLQATLGGQTREGKDAVNELSFVFLDAEEQVGLKEPDFGCRIFDDTDPKFIRRVGEVIKLGRGKPKFFFDNVMLDCMNTGYPDMPIEDLREYISTGCTESFIPFVTMCDSFCAIMNVPKIVELTLHNGRDAITGEFIGLETGDVRKFKSIGQFKTAYQKQLEYWLEYACKSIKVQMDAQDDFSFSPYSSALLEGPIEKGRDICDGGCWYTTYAIWFAGIAQAADAITSIDTLIFKEKKCTWDALLDTLLKDWEGSEVLRAYDINRIPKYGNDDDYADANAAFIMDSWCDAIAEMNKRKELIPEQGGEYVCSSIVATSPTGLGLNVGALPGGRKAYMPLSDTSSPEHGMDKLGPSAVVRSNGKLPIARNSIGNCLNQRLSPQLLATEEDMDRFVSFVQSLGELGLAEIQFNVISSELLKKAMKDPDSYRDILVRTASYSAYFVDMNERCQLDIIDRTEQTKW